MTRLLIVDDEFHVRKALGTVFKREGFLVEEATNGREALGFLKDNPGQYELMLLDLHMPEMGGMELLRTVREAFPTLLVIVFTAYNTAETTMEAMRLGAYDYIVKPFDISHIKEIVAKARERKRLIEEVKDLRKSVAVQPDGLVGQSRSMQEIYKLIGKVAASSITVLIEGESGTGKELLARQIHLNSPRAAHRLVTVNCGAIPENLLESELFGHEKGAFTGAVTRKLGKAELADQGTLFLDEVGEMPLSLQVKLLRFLQEREIDRVGGDHTVKVDVRLIAATNRNLREMVEAGQFREDLYYRLHVVNLQVPPLRERMEDLEELIQHFLSRYAKEMEVELPYLAPETLKQLRAYTWPGNIRELQNVICRSMIMASGDILLPEHLPELGAVQQAAASSHAFTLQETFSYGFTLREVVERAEMQAMQWALRETEGNKAQAARLLQMSRKAFVYKCQDYGLAD
ncbi:sigma-54 dependent transcriptional regulator [Ammoniphilus sp. YIM 78166]|uniref:sigma-54-dependent transcriptional regulator n=1 Tax=Ammoniphilus sp. YIM 78166 TaxID=1644106 RepID=UPI00106F3379|nr:sigma-54 dependent transcriptional regulator [Ammoniphilus sp. YIM 78166]